MDWRFEIAGGTTCSRFVSIVFETDDLVCAYHKGHSGYAGRMIGSYYCPTWYALYRKTEIKHSQGHALIHDKHIAKFVGRNAKRELKNYMKKYGIDKDTNVQL